MRPDTRRSDAIRTTIRENMHMNTKPLALATSLMAVAGAAHAETDLRLARAFQLAHASSEYGSLLNQENISNLEIEVQVQARYQANFRDSDSATLTNPDDDTTMGFVLRRTKVGIEGDVTDNIHGKIKFAFDRDGGVAELEDAYADWEVSDALTLRVGQFKQTLLREEEVSSSRQLASERSTMNATFNQGYSQGVEARFGDDAWRGMIGFNDGFDSDNTAFNSSAEADYALSARFEVRFGDAQWDQFKQFTSWRGASSGGMLGAAIAYQSMGDTNPSDPAGSGDMTTGTIDFSWVADGWNASVAGVWRHMAPAVGSDADDLGILAQGGFFVTDRDELFGRWDIIMPDDNSNAPNDDDFNAVTVGWNHYMVPESHAAKFTLDVAYFLDSTTGSTVVNTSDGHNLLPDSEDGQIGVTAQFQFLF